MSSDEKGSLPQISTGYILRKSLIDSFAEGGQAIAVTLAQNAHLILNCDSGSFSSQLKLGSDVVLVTVSDSVLVLRTRHTTRIGLVFTDRPQMALQDYLATLPNAAQVLHPTQLNELARRLGQQGLMEIDVGTLPQGDIPAPNEVVISPDYLAPYKDLLALFSEGDGGFDARPQAIPFNPNPTIASHPPQQPSQESPLPPQSSSPSDVFEQKTPAMVKPPQIPPRRLPQVTIVSRNMPKRDVKSQPHAGTQAPTPHHDSANLP